MMRERLSARGSVFLPGGHSGVIRGGVRTRVFQEHVFLLNLLNLVEYNLPETGGRDGATLPEQGWDWERVRPAGWEGSEALMFELRGGGKLRANASSAGREQRVSALPGARVSRAG